MSIEKVQVSMGISELMVLIVLVGLGIFGGRIKIKFKGITRRGEKPGLNGAERKLLDE